jgi:hypothetical protein
MKTTVKQFKEYLQSYDDEMEICIHDGNGNLVAVKPYLQKAKFGKDYIIIGRKFFEN